jgi:hypothetical protein
MCAAQKRKKKGYVRFEVFKAVAKNYCLLGCDTVAG